MMQTGEPRARAARRLAARPAVLAAALVLVAAVTYAAATAQHEVYDLGYSVANDRAIIESWSVKLPAGYRLAWWRATPSGPQDGLRLLGSGPEK